MRFGKIDINPAQNPAVLNTATWNPTEACEIVNSIDVNYLESVQKAVNQRKPPPTNGIIKPYIDSSGQYQGRDFLLAGLEDGQQIFIEFTTGNNTAFLSEPIFVKRLENGNQFFVYRTDAAVIDNYFHYIRPDKGPKALGVIPRIGIGTRMSTAVWPGIWRAMNQGGFAANSIQNSVRELNLLENVLSGQPPRDNYLFGFGTMQEGHTGSTFEGLWVSGVLEALKTVVTPCYGADADHIMVKCTPDGVDRAKSVIDAARYYTFFTLDISDILDYKALTGSSGKVTKAYPDKIQQVQEYKSVSDYHCRQRRIGSWDYNLNERIFRCLAGKYWSALNIVQQLYEYTSAVKKGNSFDFELSIDEIPAELDTFENITNENELIFLLLEVKRRQIPITHIAPNFGVEKGRDYRCPDGLSGLEKRVGMLHNISDEFGVMLDCHSGDDLKPETRRVFGRATKGRCHFKISPVLQLIFAEVLDDMYPELFSFWWNDTKEYICREASAGSKFAAECKLRYETEHQIIPSARDTGFTHYCFASVGKRDTEGQFIHREKFYNLPEDFYNEYQRRVTKHLCEVANDVFNSVQ